MCACRLEVGSPPSESKIDLDNYYMLAETMGDRQEGMESPGTPGEDDVYSQLAQKERDLTLAAELGKALLDRTEELERRNEQTIEEFAQKLEEMEQEKYELHLKLEKKETEYENTVKELNFDIGQLRSELHSQQNQSTTDVKERSQAIRELTLQNERLNEEVRLASSREEELQSQVHSLRDKMASRRNSMHCHVTQLEILQEEIHFLTQRKHEVESRILAVTEEKEALACSLEESQERILMLEKSKRDAEQRLQNQERDIMELQETNLQLQAQLHHMSTSVNRPHHHSNNQSQSLFSEISQMSPHLSPVTTPEMPNQFPSFEPEESIGHQISLAEMMEEDDYECDDDDDGLLPCAVAPPLNSTMLTESQFLTHFQNSPHVMETDDELRSELIHVYTQLKQMCSAIRYQQTDVAGASSKVENVPPGGLSDTLQELRGLMEDMMTFRPTITSESQVILDREDLFSVNELQKHINELKDELQGAQCDLDRVKCELTERDLQLEEKAKELGHLTNKVKLTSQHDELANLQKQRDGFQTTLANRGEVTRDELIEQARKDRDLAIEKQNKMEIELAKAKLDLLTLNGQLMDAIQQKVVLSQELDQWQVDMEELLELQMRKRIKQESDKEEVCEELKKQLQGIRKSRSTSSFLSIRKTKSPE